MLSDLYFWFLPWAISMSCFRSTEPYDYYSLIRTRPVIGAGILIKALTGTTTASMEASNYLDDVW